MPSESAHPETAAVADALLETLQALATELHRAPPARVLTLDSSLERDFGFDSLGRVELVLRVEQRFGVRLSEHLLATAETPRDVLRAILAPTAAAARTASACRPVRRPFPAAPRRLRFPRPADPPRAAGPQGFPWCRAR